MKRFIIIIIAVAALATAALICLAGCKKADHMGKIHGMWQIMSIETPDPDDPDGPLVSQPMPERRYISFQFDVVQLGGENAAVIRPGYTYCYTGTLDGEHPDYTMTFPYADTPYKMQLIAPWGITENPVRVHVSELDHSSLVMNVGGTVLTCRRF